MRKLDDFSKIKGSKLIGLNNSRPVLRTNVNFVKCSSWPHFLTVFEYSMLLAAAFRRNSTQVTNNDYQILAKSFSLSFLVKMFDSEDRSGRGRGTATPLEPSRSLLMSSAWWGISLVTAIFLRAFVEEARNEKVWSFLPSFPIVETWKRRMSSKSDKLALLGQHCCYAGSIF